MTPNAKRWQAARINVFAAARPGRTSVREQLAEPRSDRIPLFNDVASLSARSAHEGPWSEALADLLSQVQKGVTSLSNQDVTVSQADIRISSWGQASYRTSVSGLSPKATKSIRTGRIAFLNAGHLYL